MTLDFFNGNHFKEKKNKLVTPRNFDPTPSSKHRNVGD
jgi:hypothetical protein